jgi:membrane-associated phospholipid phosphatase
MALAGRRSWASVAFVEAALGSFRAGWRAHHGSEKRAFATALAIGAVACALVAAGLSLAVRPLAAAGWLDWEKSLVLGFAKDAPLDYQQALFVGQLGSSALLIPAAVLAAWLAVRQSRPLLAISIVAATFAIKAIVFVGWMVWARERPDFIEAGVAVPSGLHAFPSGHVAQTVAVYGLLVRLWCAASRSRAERVLAWALLAVLVTAIALARLRIGAHWPSDLVAGAVVGAAWLGALLIALGRGGELASASAPDPPSGFGAYQPPLRHMQISKPVCD